MRPPAVAVLLASSLLPGPAPRRRAERGPAEKRRRRGWRRSPSETTPAGGRVSLPVSQGRRPGRETGAVLCMESSSGCVSGFELLEVLDDVLTVAPKDSLPEEPEGSPEQPPAQARTKFTDPDHLDFAPGVFRTCRDLPAAPRHRIDIGVSDGRRDGRIPRPVVVTSLPLRSDARRSCLRHVRRGTAELVHLHSLNRNGRKHLFAP